MYAEFALTRNYHPSALANLIEGTVLLPLFRMEPVTADRYFSYFGRALASVLPELAAHFEQLEVAPSAYLIDWQVASARKWT